MQKQSIQPHRSFLSLEEDVVESAQSPSAQFSSSLMGEGMARVDAKRSARFLSSQSYLGHRERLREKVKKTGLKNLAEYEILEYLLTYPLPQKDVKPIAKDLINKFGSLKKVFDANYADLCQIKGVKDNAASFIISLKEFAAIYAFLNIKDSAELSSPKAVNEYLYSVLGGQTVEKIYLLFLNSANKITGSCEIESGTVNKSIVLPQKFVKEALKNEAASIIMAHNHPGGSLKPSQNDIDSTQTLKAAFAAVDITFLDHIIISGKDYFSFKEYGLL
ncbi:MAG: DNA repair protein RadC [Elusimicrobiota bacterium]|jgi:DNA repair protein RadC|nr:DNA repair protein RadC [Elusimicrobiota bacterium]